MPPLLALCPLILDQSFPRTKYELSVAAASLGAIDGMIQSGDALLVFTSRLGEILWATDWSRDDAEMSLLNDVFRYLQQLFLAPHDGVVILDLTSVVCGHPHPVPAGTTDSPQTDIWMDEIGRLLSAHDAALADRTDYFVGVATANNFAGLSSDTYATVQGRCFPLVQPVAIETALIDAYQYAEPPAGPHLVHIADVSRNYKAIGAIRLENPHGGSHFKLHFNGKRPWPLDPNVDPVAPRFLDDLADIAEMPRSVLVAALLTGQKPARELRLQPYRVASPVQAA